VVAQGTPREMMNAEDDAYVSELMATPRRQAGRLQAILARREPGR
jgi:hypothetical protein